MGQRQWAMVVPAERYHTEQMYSSTCLDLAPGAGPAPGDLVAIIADVTPQVLFGLGTASGPAIAYTRRLLDAPVALDHRLPAGFTELRPDRYASLAALAAPAVAPPARSRWLVSVALPIEAPSPAEAAREFWSYVTALGPRELPAFVAPAGDELAMQAYLLGAETNLDPEEE